MALVHIVAQDPLTKLQEEDRAARSYIWAVEYKRKGALVCTWVRLLDGLGTGQGGATGLCWLAGWLYWQSWQSPGAPLPTRPGH